MPVRSRIKYWGYIFDSPEEVDIYKSIKWGELHKLTWIDELKKIKLIETRPTEINLYKTFKRWNITIRGRKYTPDFIVKLWWKNVILEVKSAWTWNKPDYRLRRAVFLYLYWEDYNFAELIKIKKWVYKLIKYYV
jgi:hypothetical protein